MFGTDVAYTPIGAVYTDAQPTLFEPNIYQGNHFLAGVPEGIAIPIAANRFHYRHPLMQLKALV